MLTVSQIARKLGVTRQRAQQITRSSSFPRPARRRATVWYEWNDRDVDRWIAKHRDA